MDDGEEETEGCSTRSTRLDADAVSLRYQMQKQDEESKRKRMWLMGLYSDKGPESEKRLKGDDILMNESTLPEKLFREDDVFYENAKNYVQKGFSASMADCYLPSTVGDCMEVFDRCNMYKIILSTLDDLTNSGLYLLATIVTEGSVLHEKTRVKMKKFVKENLVKVLGNRCHDGTGIEICNRLSKFLKNPGNFRRHHAMFFRPSVQSHYAAIMEVINGLKDLPFTALSSMHRRLRVLPGEVPMLHPPKCGWRRARLVDVVKNSSLDLLSELGEQDELPEPLIKAMEVARLSRSLSSHDEPTIIKFYDYTPEVVDLQDKLIKAIKLLNQNVKIPELEGLKGMLFPGSASGINGGTFRKIVRRLLMELLFECNELDAIPATIFDAVAVLINSSAVPDSKEVIEEEVECILRVSAQVKQMLWDLLPDFKVDLDFFDAYMEELEDSDEEESIVAFDEGEEFEGSDDKESVVKVKQFDEEVASTTDDLGFTTPLSTSKLNNSIMHPTTSSCAVIESTVKQEPDTKFDSFSADRSASTCSFRMRTCFLTADSVITEPSHAVSSMIRDDVKASYEEQIGNIINKGSADNLTNNSSSSLSKEDVASKYQGTERNLYLAIQDLSDETSLFSYQLIGRLLDEFAREDGLTINLNDQTYLNNDGSLPVDLVNDMLESLKDEFRYSDNQVAKQEKARLEEMQMMKKQKIQEILDKQNASIDADMNNKGKDAL